MHVNLYLDSKLQHLGEESYKHIQFHDVFHMNCTFCNTANSVLSEEILGLMSPTYLFNIHHAGWGMDYRRSQKMP